MKHQGTNITGYVISYNREHKICTGIGNLTVEIDRTIPRTFEPWQTVDIWENGSFKVRYYVSSVEDSEPKGVLVLDCQDISKRLVDYFIPDSYTVDYPSYTRYWIEKFLTEAGVDYQFTTSSQGTLLSNFTQLGLVTVYEQLTVLLQMSGWYIYFNGNEKAVIGSLDLNLATGGSSINKTDILSISKQSNDRMLRNRALVLGAFDPYRGGYASADVSVHTPWNYDHSDLRTVVISNSNIKDRNTAYGMANQIVKEFARITEEKHISLWGARNFNLGTSLRVSSDVWRGRGLITTFGVEMSKNGLITNIVLDERCPRLFGYFDFGDYVYVATFGDGVWRKHIKYDNTFYNFSTGLTDLRITDMHINNGVFGSVGASGQLYYAVDTLPWHQITITGLMSSMEDTVTGSGDIALAPFSGIMARATIVDKMGNILRFGVDNTLGLNYGDYAMMVSGWMTAASGVSMSGVSASGGHRGWVVEYDVLAGDLVGASYPISLSGNYNYSVLDIDNDGKNDYVSVRTIGSGGSSSTPMNFGYHLTQPFGSTLDYTSNTFYPSAESVADISNGIHGGSASFSLNTKSPNAAYSTDDQANGKSFIVTVGSDNKANKKSVTKTKDPFTGIYSISSVSTITSAANTSIAASDEILGIYPNNYDDSYRIFYRKGSVFGSGNASYYYIDWSAYTNTFGTETLIFTAGRQGGTCGVVGYYTLVSGNTIYNMAVYLNQPGTSGGFYTSAAHLFVDKVHIDMSNLAYVYDPMLDFVTPQGPDLAGRYYYFPGDGADDAPDREGSTATFAVTNFGLFQNGTGIQIIGRTEIYYYFLSTPWKATQEWTFIGNESTITATKIYDDSNNVGTSVRRFPGANLNAPLQLTTTRGVVSAYGHSSGRNSYAWNGTNYIVTTSTGSKPAYLDFTKVLPMFANNGNKYIVNDTTFKIYDALTLTLDSTITAPTGYTIRGIASTGLTAQNSNVYALIRETATFDNYIVPFNFTTFDVTRRMKTASFTMSSRTVNFGNWFIRTALDFNVVTPLSSFFYYDFGNPDVTPYIFQILRRDGSSFTLIEQESYPMRVDISNNSPVVTVGSGEGSFVSNYVYDSDLVVIEPTASGVRTVDDYRYTFLEPTLNSLVSSGVGGFSTILYVHESGIFGADALTYSGGFGLVYGVPSGYGTRIETSNYGVGGQYVFITASGFMQVFYQKDPGAVSFTAYSGVPQSRATIIRLDDAV